MKKFLIFSVAAVCLSATVNAQVDTTKRDTTRRRDSTNIQQPISFHRNAAHLSTASDFSVNAFMHDAILQKRTLTNMKKQEEVTA